MGSRRDCSTKLARAPESKEPKAREAGDEHRPGRWLGYRDASEQAVGFAVDPRGEIERVGATARGAVPENQTPKTINHREIRAGSIQRGHPGPILVYVNYSVTEVPNQQIARQRPPT